MTLLEDEPFPGLGGSADGKRDTFVERNLELIVTASFRLYLARSMIIIPEMTVLS